ncbi:MAG: TIM barrel protein [Burkholderiaceae bacterium]|nr:TIM barrel protein [Burkholderiaceae bacterium]
MPRFAANISLMYAEWPFADRFAAAADDGFEAVECQFPYDVPAETLARRREAAGVELVLLNAPPGPAGARGIAAVPGQEAAFRTSLLAQALPYAQALNCPRVHVMSGFVAEGGERADVQPTLVDNLRWAAEQAARVGVTLLVEPLNGRDNPGYFLNRQDHGHEIVAMVGAANVAVQFDLYHAQIVEGDLSAKLARYLDPAHPTKVGHLQIAAVPDRGEPDAGELAWGHLFALIDQLGWGGWVGAEYRPRAGTRAGLGWFQPWRRR